MSIISRLTSPKIMVFGFICIQELFKDRKMVWYQMFFIFWKSIWVFPRRLEGCLLSDHLPPNKPKFPLPHFKISDIRPEGYLNILIYLISDCKSSTFANFWDQTGRLSEYFQILISDQKVIHISKYTLF